MLNTNRIRRIVMRIPVVTSKTKWAFIEVEDSSGAVGTGEATLMQQEAALAGQLHDIGPALLGKPADPELLIPLLDPHNLPRAAIISALDQALSDLCAQHAGLSLCAMIGLKRDRVGLYANINRRTWNQESGHLTRYRKRTSSRGTDIGLGFELMGRGCCVETAMAG